MSTPCPALIERIVRTMNLTPEPVLPGLPGLPGCQAARLDDGQLLTFAMLPTPHRLLVAAQIGHARAAQRHGALTLALLANTALSADAQGHWTYERQLLGWCLRRMFQLPTDEGRLFDGIGAFMAQAQAARREWRRIGMLVE